jgi:hypothetical protein
MTRKRQISNPREMIFNLKKNCIPFELTQTMFTKKIECEYGTFNFLETGTALKPRDLAFINIVKKYCTANVKKAFFDRSAIQYIGESKLKKNYNYSKDIYEIDLTGAYWNFAYKEGFISENIYLRGLEVPKLVRLISLGNLAKRSLYLNFDGNEYTGKPEYLKSSETEHIFFKVSELTDILIRKLVIIAKKDFLFYWVDAVFFQGQTSLKNISEYLESEDIKFKVIKIDNVIKKENLIITHDEQHIKKDNPTGKREFNFIKRSEPIK